MKNVSRFLALALPLAAASAHASMIIDNTRIVFPGEKNEVTVKLQNKGDLPALAKMWLDTGDGTATPETVKVPFFITPPIARVEPGHSQAVRVVYTGETLPQDRESVFWFNMLDVPPKQTDNPAKSLQFAFDTRIKLFFRPKGLPGSIEQAMKGLKWRVVPQGQGFALSVTNPSPYYVSLGKVSVMDGGTVYVAKSDMVPPIGSSSFDLPLMKTVPSTAAVVKYYAINDFGGAVDLQGSLLP